MSRDDRTASGERRSDPSPGAEPLGLLVYDRGGHFAAQFMKRDRSGAGDEPATGAGANNSRARGGYDAYCGALQSGVGRSARVRSHGTGTRDEPEGDGPSGGVVRDPQ